MRGGGDDAEAGGAGAVDLLVSGVSAVGGRGACAPVGTGELWRRRRALIKAVRWIWVGTAGLVFIFVLPPPKIFWKMFFFFWGAGWVALGVLPSGGLLAGRCAGPGRGALSGIARLLRRCSGRVVWGLCGRRCRRAFGRSSAGTRTSGCRCSAGRCRRGRRRRRYGWGRWRRRGGWWSGRCAATGDAFGGGEGFHVGVLRKLDGALHELGPDGRGGVGAFDLDVGVVVVADPDDAERFEV